MPSPAQSMTQSIGTRNQVRIALFGGTFDPVHRGHLAIARVAADRMSLTKVLLAPTGVQPLKPGGASAAFPDRLAMVELGCQGDERFAASDLDAPRTDGAPNYTIDTLLALRRTMPEAAIFNLVGADSFLGFRRWRGAERLLDLAEWIVVSRPGSPVSTRADLAPLHLTSQQDDRVHLLAGVHEDVSSTQLRERLKLGDRCEDLLPAAVAEYIAARGLYR